MSEQRPSSTGPEAAVSPQAIPPEAPPVPAPAPANTLRAPAPELVADTARSLDINRFITQGYIELAHELQRLLDPDYRPGGTSQALLNWFVFAPHASQEAGKGMLGAHLARAIIDAAQGEPATSVQHALDRARMLGPERRVAETVADTLRWFGLSHDVAASLGTLLSAANIDAFVDPRTLWMTALRFTRLLHDAPGATLLEKTEAVARTLEQLLLDGNVAIYGDIAGSARKYLEWRRSAGGDAVTSAQVVEGFALEESRPEEARRAWAYAMEHLLDSPPPVDFARELPDVSGHSLVVAAFALFEDARRAPGPTRDALIAFANNYLAWREQHDAVRPAFAPAAPPDGEVPRLALMLAMTPTLRLQLGPVAWELTDFTAKQKDRDHNFLTSKPTEYNWAVFEDRWPAILDSFEFGYRHQEALWQMPQPLTDALDLVELE